MDRWLSGPIRGDSPQGKPTATASLIRVRVDGETTGHFDGYRLMIRPGEIEVVGNSAAGCFYGLQTLAQLRSGDEASIPCCTIEDWPDFPTRGLLHDVTRGKTPTLATLKLLIDRLAQLQANQLQLYIEHAFVFSFDEEICGTDEGLTPDEIRELGAYCHERFIELVPAVATPGHMGRILSMPRYRHLAELEAEQTWSETPWPQRTRGLTLDCLNPESHQLVENIWSDVMNAFTGKVVNICGDEPWDLGKGRNRDRIDETGVTEAYVEHLRRVYQQCSARGRRVQVWSDVLCNHREILTRLPTDRVGLPTDLTILHWGYDDNADYDATRCFVEAGFRTFVCPGTSGWKQIINAVELAERNITTFARRGLECGASGLINTDWGDHGHFNLLGCSWHGIALGAACGWDAGCAGGDDFDARLCKQLWDLEDAAAMQDLRKASQWASTCETWRLFWMPLDKIRGDSALPTTEAAEEASHFAKEFQRKIDEVAPGDTQTRRDFDELHLACRFTQLLAGKIAILHGAAPGDWPQQLIQAVNPYATLWNARNKPSGLSDILTALQNAADDVRSDRA